MLRSLWWWLWWGLDWPLGERSLGADWWGEGLCQASHPIRCPVQQMPFPEARSRSGRTPWRSIS